MSSTYTSGTQGLMSIDGIVSGLDTTSILNQLAAVRQQPITEMQNEETDLKDRLTLYSSLEAQVDAVQSAAQALADPSTFEARSVDTSGASVLTAAADAGAPLGSYSITVNQLAQAQKIRSNSFSASDQPLGLQGEFLVNGKDIAVQSGDDLLNVATAINNANAGVQATVLEASSSDYRLMLTSLNTGTANAIDLRNVGSSDLTSALGLTQSTETAANPITNGLTSAGLTSQYGVVGDLLGLQSAPSGNITINGTQVAVNLGADSLQNIADRINSTVSGVTASVVSNTGDDGTTTYQLSLVGASGTPTVTDDNNVLDTLGFYSEAPTNQVQAAQDAQAVVDGVSVTRSTNNLDDVIPGLHLQLTAADPSEAETVTVSGDVSSEVSAVQSLVDQYNKLVDLTTTDTKYDPTSDTGGELAGNYDVMAMSDSLREAVTSPIDGVTGTDSLVSQIGITTDQNDHLVLDQNALTQALTNDPSSVEKLFSIDSNATSPYVTYVSSTSSTQSSASGYAVDITRPATQATATSATLASGITQNETLTFNGSQQVTLTAGMSLSDAASAMNSMFSSAGYDLTAAVQNNQLTITDGLYGSDYGFTVSSSLAQGAGGLDLGGATAGTAASYNGTDVAGTIDGEAATGSGQYLTGDDGNTNTAGLKLQITATTAGSYGSIEVAKGVGQRLVDAISQLEDPTNGLFARATQSLNQQITDKQNDIDQMNADLQSYLDEMRNEFTTMEEAMSKAQAISQYLTTQLAGLTGSTSSTSSASSSVPASSSSSSSADSSSTSGTSSS